MILEIKRPMYKKEIAEIIGISGRTLTNWINRNERLKNKVARRGLIPISLVRMIFEEFVVDVELK